MKKLFILLFILAVAGTESFAQCPGIEKDCKEKIIPFTPDGHGYSDNLKPGESFYVKTVFYAHVKYRLVTCNGASENSRLAFSMYDPNGTLMYSNEALQDADRWTFMVGATGEYTIHATLLSNKKDEKANAPETCATLLMGYSDALSR